MLESRVLQRLPKPQAEHVFRVLAKNYISFEEIERGLTRQELVCEVNLLEEEADALLLSDFDWPRRNLCWIDKAISNLPPRFDASLKLMVRSALTEAFDIGLIRNEEHLKNMGAEELSKAKIPVAARVWLSEAYRTSLDPAKMSNNPVVVKTERIDDNSSVNTHCLGNQATQLNQLSSNAQVAQTNCQILQNVSQRVKPTPKANVQTLENREGMPTSAVNLPFRLNEGPRQGTTFDNIPSDSKCRQKNSLMRRKQQVADNGCGSVLYDRKGMVSPISKATDTVEKNRPLDSGSNCGRDVANKLQLSPYCTRGLADDTLLHKAVAKTIESEVASRRFVPRISPRSPSSGPAATTLAACIEALDKSGFSSQRVSEVRREGEATRRPRGVSLNIGNSEAFCSSGVKSAFQGVRDVHNCGVVESLKLAG